MSDDLELSPVLIMEFIRKTVMGVCLNEDNINKEVKFKLSNKYYNEVMESIQKQQLIHLIFDYNEKNEVLTVKADEDLINRFKEQKSMFASAIGYEEKYQKRYKNFIEVIK